MRLFSKKFKVMSIKHHFANMSKTTKLILLDSLLQEVSEKNGCPWRQRVPDLSCTFM